MRVILCCFYYKEKKNRKIVKSIKDMGDELFWYCVIYGMVCVIWLCDFLLIWYCLNINFCFNVDIFFGFVVLCNGVLMVVFD